jgi:hypothetical protein
VTLQTSLSQPGPPKQSKSNSRRHLTLPEPLNNNNYPQCSAELYVSARSQMLVPANEQKDLSPETPSSITASTINSFPLNMGYADVMNNWRQKKTYEICKKHKHRYVYGTPPSSSLTSPTALGFAFPQPTQTFKKG